jgi:PKD repeat protein
MAEQSVFVDALSSSLGAGTPLTANYQWNFGDPGSPYNILPGWNAGHIYNNPGTYTITLTITNQAGSSNSLSTQVSVTNNARRTIYVDAVSGNDNNSGASASQAVRTPARAQALLGSNTTLLFHRGQTFTFDRTLNLNYHEVVVGAYGSGAAPVMKKVPGAPTSGIGIFWTGAASDQVVVENLTFDSVYTPAGNVADHIPAVGVYAGGRNITVRNNTFLNIDDAVNSYSGPDGVLIENNTCPLPTGLRGYLDYINGSDAVILGNSVVNTTREHIIRSTDDTTQRVLIAGNNLDNSYSRQGVDPLDFPKCTINIRAGHYVYIANNVLSDGMAGFGPGPWTPASDSCEWVVLDGNRFHNAQLYLAGNVHHLIARNNLFDIENTAQIQLRPLDPDYSTRMMSDITLTYNTGVTASSKGSFLELDGGSPAGIITVTNNLFAAPNFQPGQGFAAPVYVRAPDLSAFRRFDNNIWPAPTSLNRYKIGGVNYVAVGLDMLRYLTSQEWNALSNVGSDQFLRVAVSGNSLQTSNGRVLVGAVLPAALR